MKIILQGFIVLYFFIPGWVLLLMSFTYKECDIDIGDDFGILSTWPKPSPTLVNSASPKKSFNMSWAGYKHYFIVDTESHRTSANRKESSNRRWMSS